MDTSDRDAAQAVAVADDDMALVPTAAVNAAAAEDDDDAVATLHVGRAAAAYALREGVDTALEFHAAFHAARTARSDADGHADAASDAHSERDPADAGSGALPWTEEDAAHAAAVFAPRPAAFDDDSSDDEAGGMWPAPAPVPVGTDAADLTDAAMLDDEAELAAMATRRTAEAAGYHALPMDLPADDDDLSPEALVAARQINFIAGGAGRAPTVVVDRAIVAMADHEVSHIQSVMASFALPDHAVPPWARALKDSDWIPTLAFADERQPTATAAAAPPPSSGPAPSSEQR